MNDVPRFPGERIRADIESAILCGAWPPGTRVPSEHALVAQYGCSRMTVNKVISALATAGLVVRRRHAGSFVAAPRGERAMMEIQNLAEEAARLGLPYQHEILRRDLRAATREDARAPGLRLGTPLLHVVCRHWIDDRPYALEDRLISLAQVPAARDQDFAAIPPGTWLLHTAPWSEAEHMIRAHEADAATAVLLAMPVGAACLALHRRTWHAGRLVTDVTLTYPGARHSFAGRVSPTGDPRSCVVSNALI
jgi:GntR family histidine utilization transcriptional repressor